MFDIKFFQTFANVMTFTKEIEEWKKREKHPFIYSLATEHWHLKDDETMQMQMCMLQQLANIIFRVVSRRNKSNCCNTLWPITPSLEITIPRELCHPGISWFWKLCICSCTMLFVSFHILLLTGKRWMKRVTKNPRNRSESTLTLHNFYMHFNEQDYDYC